MSVGVAVAVFVGATGVSVGVAVAVLVGAMGVFVGVFVGVAVAVLVGVAVGVSVGVAVADAVTVCAPTGRVAQVSAAQKMPTATGPALKVVSSFI